MWNRILNAIVREKAKADYDRYKRALEHIVKTLTEVLEEDDTITVIAFGKCFEKALKEER